MQAASAEGITYTHGYDFTWLKGQQSKGCPIVNVIGADVCRVIMWVFLSQVRMKPEPSGSITTRAVYVTLLHN